MDLEQKKKEYQELCEKYGGGKSYIGNPLPNSKGIGMTAFLECEEINAWTYWQGRGNYDPKILLVGQDYSEMKEDGPIAENIRRINEGELAGQTCNIGVKLYPTDENLCELFKSIGYPEVRDRRYKDLFFTNLCLGYREQGGSGNCNRKWLIHDSEAFIELLQILEPDIAICLGKDAFWGVDKILGLRSGLSKCSYNRFIMGNPRTYNLPSTGKHIHIFAMAHCGAMGTLNRNERKNASLDIQKGDWAEVDTLLTSLGYPRKKRG